MNSDISPRILEPGQRKVRAVQDVSLSIEKGEIFGIIGFSGAGKSTLVRCINLLERPTAGTVTVDSKDMISLSPKELRQARKKIGMIFQHFNLMPSRTVSGNVAYPLRGSGLSRQEIAAKVHKLLALVGLGIRRKPIPASSQAGRSSGWPSHGLWPTTPASSCATKRPPPWDPQTTKAILQLLKQLNEKLGITIVIITHEMAVVKEICDRVAVMEHGQVVEQDEVFRVFADPRQEITKSFLHTTSNLQKIEELIAEDSPVARRSRESSSSASPMCSEMFRNH